MKYKIGEKVVIKTWKQLEEGYGLNETGDIKLGKSRFSKHINDVLDKYSVNRVLEIEEVQEEIDIGFDVPGYQMVGMGANWTDEVIECSLKEKEEEEFRTRPVVSRFELMDFSDEV